MATLQGIGSDHAFNAAGQSSVNTGSGFANTMDTLALIAGNVSPVVQTSFLAAGNTGAATIAGVTGNAVFSSAAGAASMAGGNPYAMTSGYTGGANYLTGGSSMNQTVGTTTGMATDVEGILAETATSQSYLLGLQATMGQQQTMFTGISNAMKAKFDTERNAVGNFR